MWDSSATARSAASLPKTCGSRRRRAGFLARRSCRAGRLHRLGRHGEPGRAGGAALRVGRKKRRVVPGLQFGLARRKTACRCPDRWRWWPLCRRRGDDIGSSIPHQGALAARRQRRPGACTDADGTRLRRQGRERRSARGRGNRARNRPLALVGARHRRASGLGRRSRRRGPVRSQGHQGICPQPRLAHRSGPNPRQAQPRGMKDAAMEFQKTPGWLDWYAGPSRPRFKLPAGAVDAHCHVFGPGAEFPYAPERKYTPCDASKRQLYALRDHLGFTRNVVVQATCHGADNRAMVDALIDSGGKARGVATVRRSVSDAELNAMHAAGVRGVRFNFVKRLVDFTPQEELIEIAGRIGKLGWHVVIYFEAVDLPELWDFFTSLPTAIIVDHMGRPDVSKPVDGPEFELFVKFMRDHANVWCKVSCPERLSQSGPPALNGEQNAYRDVIPFARRIVETFPDRVLWGTDWPHPNLKNHMPDDGLLVDFIRHIATTPDLQRKLLVDNPMRLYWPEEATGR